MVAVTELGYVCFGVSDLDAWREFRRRICWGWKWSEEPGEPDRLYLRTDYWHHRIILEKNSSDDLTAAGLRVGGVEEFAAMQQVLKDAGVKFEVGGKDLAASRRVLEIMRLSDPAGNPIEIFHGPRIDTYRPFLPGAAHARAVPHGR